ncbi:SDR family NAD(P)-dependent oxidoreductase [Glaciihabitans sp. UYNi722]|uniref:SDR family NAD(P)-dependent oxidoreductase n=1 Tax=Glaciihabitans sp. UYNi722 TaxID=3156344 RepID=UPI003395E9CA
MTASVSSSRLALVTGATAGIGAEFARQLAGDGWDLVLVARDLQRLESLAAELRAGRAVQVEVLAADLVSREGLDAVETRVAASAPRRVTMLVNNAGFGLRESFEQNSVEDEQRLLDLLVTAPMRLSHAALDQMLAARAGTIVNIASVAGFTPRGTYGAAKAWVLSFSRWANISYRSRGVSVTAVAPGFVHTEFHDRMEVSKAGVPGFLWLDAATLVRLALRDVKRGKAISVPTVRYKVIVWFSGWLPKRIVAAGALRGR